MRKWTDLPARDIASYPGSAGGLASDMTKLEPENEVQWQALNYRHLETTQGTMRERGCSEQAQAMQRQLFKRGCKGLRRAESEEGNALAGLLEATLNRLPPSRPDGLWLTLPTPLSRWLGVGRPTDTPP